MYSLVISCFRAKPGESSYFEAIYFDDIHFSFHLVGAEPLFGPSGIDRHACTDFE